MAGYQECKRCVMDTSDPHITMDDDGHCNHCITALEKMPDVMRRGEAGRMHMKEMVAAIRQRNKHRDYDAVIGLSGGVDSSFAVIVAHNAGLRLLAVHCDTGWNSEEATHNIHSLVNTLGIDLETVVIDWESMRDLQAAFFWASVPNCDIPQDHAIVAVNNQVAAAIGVKDFISGGNFSSESILPSAWGHDPRDLKHLRAISRLYGNGRLRGYPSMGALKAYVWLPFVRGVRSYRILNDIDYHLEQAKRELKCNYRWKDYGGKHHESRFTRFFQTYYLPEKFGFDKRRAHFSSVIVAGQMTKEGAQTKLEKPLYDPRKLELDREYFLKKLRLSDKQWEVIMKTSPRRHEEFPNQLTWQRWRSLIKRSLEKHGIRVRGNW